MKQQRPFITEGKSLHTAELASGDLELRGYAAVWEGLDASGENFLRGSFRKAIPAFLAGPAALVYHHDSGKVLGRVLELEEDAKGVRIRARVDRQSESSPLRHLFEMVKRGTLRGLSTGGYFSRTEQGLRRMIAEVLRITEVSITGVPQHPLTSAHAIEVKALGRQAALAAAERELAILTAHLRLQELALERAALERLRF